MKKIRLYQGEAKPLVIRIKDRLTGEWSNLEDSICFLVTKRMPEDSDVIFTKLDADFDKTTARDGYLSLFLTPWETWQEPWTYFCQLEINNGGASLSKLLFEMEILGSISANDFTIITQGIESQEAFGTPSLVNYNIVPAEIASEEVFGDIVVSNTAIIINYNIEGVGIDSQEIFGWLTISPLTMFPGSIDSREFFGTSAISPSVFRINFNISSMDDIASQEAFGIPSFSPFSIVPYSIEEQTTGWFVGEWFVEGWFAEATEVVGEPIVTTTYFIVASMDEILSEEVFGSPVLSPISLMPGYISSQEAFGTSILSTSIPIIRYNLAPVGITTQEVCGILIISPLSIFPGGVSSREVFGASVVSGSAPPVIRYNIYTVGIISRMAFGRPQLKRLPRAKVIKISPTGIASKQVFGNPSLTIVPTAYILAWGSPWGYPWPT
jgi:hypothetical protein